MRHIGTLNRRLREQDSNVRIVREGRDFRLVDIRDDSRAEKLDKKELRALARQINGDHK